MMGIEKTKRMSDLLDAYGSLLTEKQRNVVQAYYEEDFSLSEIADNLKISRAGVSDHLRRSEKMLEEYENKLKLVEKMKTRSEIYDKIKEFQNRDINVLVDILENLNN